MREQEVRELYEAYMQVHQPQEEVEQLDEFLGSGAAKVVDNATKAVQTGLEKLGVPINRTLNGPVTGPQQKKKIEGNVKEDLFDIIKGHLIDEGYADTNESALAIMANMSEEWREEILDEEVRGAKKGTIRSVIEKGGKSIKYVQSGGDILAGDRSSQERASAADRTTSGRNRANAARFQQDAKKSIETLNANPGEDPEDYGNTDDDHSGGKRHYKLGSTNRSSRARRASGR